MFCLEEHPELEHLFDSMDADRILEELSFSANVNLSAGVIVFIDEVQAAPSALGAMAYMRVHRPDLYYVAAGSLLEIALSKKKISIPVGRMDNNFMGPLTFEEFLTSNGSVERELELIRNWTPGNSFSIAAHRRLVDLLTGARVIFPVVHSAGNGVPLNAESRPSVFKLYFLDVGLMSNMTGIVHISLEQVYHQARKPYLLSCRISKKLSSSIPVSFVPRQRTEGE